MLNDISYHETEFGTEFLARTPKFDVILGQIGGERSKDAEAAKGVFDEIRAHLAFFFQKDGVTQRAVDVCHKCGARLYSNYIYCPFCGTRR